MARARKRHVQQAMFDRHGRLVGNDGKPKGRGGARPGAGRKPKGKRAGAPHKKRPTLKSWQPVHVVLRVVDAMGSLRKRHMYKALREATISVAKRELNDLRDGAFRIVHVSIQRTHVHLIIEADHKTALSRGLQSFEISAAKQLNRAVSIVRVKQASGSRAGRGAARPAPQSETGAQADATLTARYGAVAPRALSATTAKRLLRQNRDWRRRGSVFPDRFHQEIISTPRQAHHTLAYVLNNWRKHGEDRGELERTWKVDPFSTGVLFDGWRERASAKFYMDYRETYQPMVVYLPRTWLLNEGWRKHGLIPFGYVPSAKQMERARAAAA